MIQSSLFALALLACNTPEPAAPAPEAPAEPAKVAPAPEAVPASRRVFFEAPEDGAVVTSPVRLQFGVEGMEVQPAGEVVAGTGHHHVIINSEGVAEGQPVPADDKHIHFGAGQTEAEIELPPGKHTLTMQFADGAHMSYGDVMAAKITVTVEE